MKLVFDESEKNIAGLVFIDLEDGKEIYQSAGGMLEHSKNFGWTYSPTGSTHKLNGDQMILIGQKLNEMNKE